MVVSEFSIGQKVEYYSPSYNEWIECRIALVRESGQLKLEHLDGGTLKEAADPSRVRAVPGAAATAERAIAGPRGQGGGRGRQGAGAACEHAVFAARGGRHAAAGHGRGGPGVSPTRAAPDIVTQLCDMGFPRAEVERCLAAAFNNPERALQYLMSGMEGQAPKEVKFPTYWKSQSMQAPSIFAAESKEVRDAMQQLFDKTWKNQWTRDRGRDSKGVPKFEVVAVQRNENPKIWAKYYTFREQLGLKIAASGGTQRYDAKTASMVRGEADAADAERLIQRAGLREDVNEFYLLHGTKPSAAKAICDSDFLITKAGSNAGTRYGPGLYFAEASTKSDEYATDDKDGSFANLFGIIVCRVTCGAINYTDKAKPSAQRLVDSVLQKRTHHSILDDREKFKGTYREFMIFDNQQVYPEFVVLYRRID